MAISIVMPRAAPQPGRPVRLSRPVRIALPGARAERAVQFATAGLLAYVALTFVWLAQIFLTEENAAKRHATWDVIGLASCLPLFVPVVLAATSGRRTRPSPWLVAGLAVVVIGVLPVGGVLWLVVVQYLAGAVLLAFPLGWALPAFAIAVLLPLLVTYLEHQPQWTTYMCVNTLSVGLSLGVLTWLVRAVGQAHAARVQLADQAVIAERARIDAELTRSVSLALEHIVAAGEQAQSRTAETHGTTSDLENLVAYSRRTLNRTRRMLAGYQTTSAEAELQTAVALLAGAGMQARLDVPADALPATLTPGLRSELRAGIARILADDGATGCTISVARDIATGDSRLRFAVQHTTSGHAP